MPSSPCTPPCTYWQRPSNGPTFEPKPKSENQNVDRGRGQKRVRAPVHCKGKTYAGRHETPKTGVMSSEEKLPCSNPRKMGQNQDKDRWWHKNQNTGLVAIKNTLNQWWFNQDKSVFWAHVASSYLQSSLKRSSEREEEDVCGATTLCIRADRGKSKRTVSPPSGLR